MVLQTNLDPKCQDLPKFSFSGGGGGGSPDQLKSQVSGSVQISIWGVGGGGWEGGGDPDQHS